jgi:hypothetical protein
MVVGSGGAQAFVVAHPYSIQCMCALSFSAAKLQQLKGNAEQLILYSRPLCMAGVTAASDKRISSDVCW